MKLNIPLALALVAVATGCASHRENIPFSDEAELRAMLAAPTAPSASNKHLNVADEGQIEQLAFDYLIENHPWNVARCNAIFIQADDQEAAAIAAKFPNNAPPIKPVSQAVLKSHRPPRDRNTKQPGILLTVEISAVNADDSVDATGRWYAGESATDSRGLHLKKVNDAWQVIGGGKP